MQYLDTCSLTCFDLFIHHDRLSCRSPLNCLDKQYICHHGQLSCCMCLNCLDKQSFCHYYPHRCRSRLKSLDKQSIWNIKKSQY